MLTLSLYEYAWYAAIYLGYAFVLSATFATLSDVWARAKRNDSPHADDPHAYYAVLTSLSSVAGLLTFTAILVASHEIDLSLLAAAATTLAIFRAGSRYYALSAGSPVRIGIADLSGAALGVAVILAPWPTPQYSLRLSLAVWAIVNLAQIAVSRSRPVVRPKLTCTWLKSERAGIVPLLSEAALMNSASLGTPYIVGAILGAPGIAILRSATSLVYPVRLILGALRSRIISGTLQAGRRTTAAFLCLGILLGGIAAATLSYLHARSFGTGTAFGLVSQYPLSIALLIAATTASTYLQFNARALLPARQLIHRRLIHTGIVLSGTTGIAAIAGLDAAVLGAAVSTLGTVPVWLLRDKRSMPTTSRSPLQETQ